MVGLSNRRVAGGWSHAPLISSDSVRRRRLANGLTVLARRDSSAPVVAIVTYVSSGYFDETDDVVGIAHVLEHMYFKGTPTRGVGEISKETKALGGYLNAATIYDHTSYYTVLPSSAFADGLAIQADAYGNSLIDAEELRRELEVIIEEAKRKADNPSAVATETLYELLHDRHRIRRWRIGREKELRTFTADGVRNFYRSFYHPENTVLTIVGDVDPERAIAEAERRYGGLPAGSVMRARGPLEEGNPGFRYKEIAGDIVQTQLVFGWRAPGTMHSDAPALDLLATVLSSGRASRLFRGVRDRKLVSSIAAYHYTPTDLGVFVVHGEARPEKALLAIQAIWDQLMRARAGEITGGEVERAKRIYESRWIRQLEDMEGQANHLAAWQALGDWRYADDYLARFMGTTTGDLVDVANRWLSPGSASILVYRPSSSTVVAADAATMRANLSAAPPAPIELPPNPDSIAGPIPRPVSLRRTIAGVTVFDGPGGVPILVRRKPGALLTHVGMFVIGGACEEPNDRAGLTLLMSRTAARGSKRRDAVRLAEDSEMLGGSIAASVTADSFGWSISVPSGNSAGAIALLGEVVQQPAFDAVLLENERAAAVAAVISTRDDMYRYPMRLATEAAFAGHSYGVPSTGTEESLQRITRDDIERWHEAKVTHGASVIVIVGDGDSAELAAMVAGAFGSLSLAPPPALPTAPWPRAAVEIIEPRSRAQSGIALLFPGPSRTDEARFPMSLIGTIGSGLGGRLFEELREKRSLCYTVQTSLAERWKGGAFAAYIATSSDKEGAARGGLLDELDKIRRAGVTKEELVRAQTYSIGTRQIHMQSGGSVLGEVIDAWLFGRLEELDETEGRIRAVTLDDIQVAAMRYLDPSRRVEAIVRGAGEAEIIR